MASHTSARIRVQREVNPPPAAPHAVLPNHSSPSIVLRVAPIRKAFPARLLGLTLAGATAVQAALWVSPERRRPQSRDRGAAPKVDRARPRRRAHPEPRHDRRHHGVHRRNPPDRPAHRVRARGFRDERLLDSVHGRARGAPRRKRRASRCRAGTSADRSRSLWWAPAPDGLVDSRDLFVNGVPASRTRARLLQALVRNPSGVTVVAPDARVQWRNPGDVEFPPPEPGAIWSERLGSPPFFVMNAFELLGTPGEWYFDRPARRIYYTPRAGRGHGRC